MLGVGEEEREKTAQNGERKESERGGKRKQSRGTHEKKKGSMYLKDPVAGNGEG